MSKWRTLTRRQTLDILPTRLLSSCAGVVPPVPPFVSDVPAKSIRLRQAPILGLPEGPSLPAGIRPLPGTTEGSRLGRLCQGSLRWPSQVLDYVGRYTHHVAISNHRLVDYRRWPRSFRLERLSRQQSAKDDGSVG